jgi:stage II sporulation protein D
VTALAGGKLTTVNLIDLERYVCGVLKAEIGDRAPIEAMKAQAIAARTYAVRRLGSFLRDDADLDDTTRSQGYLGKDGESPWVLQAVKDTRGKVLTYNGVAIEALYSTDCGGVTAEGEHDEPYLKSVVDNSCATRIHWSLNISSRDLAEDLAQAGYPAKTPLESIAITKNDSSSRIREIVFSFKNGASVTLSGSQLRHILGPDRLKSTLCKASIEKNGDCVFDGKGWGHGLGMCQAGAVARASASMRESCEKILAFYYPDTQLVHLSPQIVRATFSPSRVKSVSVSAKY